MEGLTPKEADAWASVATFEHYEMDGGADGKG